MISVSPDSLLLHRKVLNSLTWDVWFSLRVISDVLTTCIFFFCKNSSMSWLIPYLFGAVPGSDLRGYFPGLRPQKICQIEHNSQLLDSVCVFFSQSTSLSMVCHSGFGHHFSPSYFNNACLDEITTSVLYTWVNLRIFFFSTCLRDTGSFRFPLIVSKMF